MSAVTRELRSPQVKTTGVRLLENGQYFGWRAAPSPRLASVRWRLFVDPLDIVNHIKGGVALLFYIVLRAAGPGHLIQAMGQLLLDGHWLKFQHCNDWYRK